MNKTPLFARHEALGARIIDFGGWAMPVQYTNVIEEHHATRQRVTLFDTCHMGEIDVSGPEALPFLQKALTRDLTALETGQMRLSLLVNEKGGILDDLTVYCLGPDRYRLVTNASTRGKDYRWLVDLREKTGCRRVDITDRSDAIGKIDIQGPRAEGILQGLVPVLLKPLSYYTFLETSVGSVPAVISRSGYTGEDGFEVYTAAEDAGRIWDLLLDAGRVHGIRPAGLGARDTLRLEAGMMLYGNEMCENVTPYEVVYGWLVNLDKDFVGRDALARQKQEGIRRKLVGFRMEDRGIARHGYSVLSGGAVVGDVTSGTFAPTLQRAVGMAFVSPDCREPGTSLTIRIRQSEARATVVPLPFYRREKKNEFYNTFI
ncbi:MAG: glycine cleavage system aminomethyltransferase GcvT [Syntrophales bacterium]